MKYFLTLIAFLLLFVANSYCHSGIQGKVIDAKSKAPLSASYIKILNTENRITYTEQDGRFEFRHLTPGSYYLEFVHLGYKSRIDTMVVLEERITNITISLTEDIMVLPEIMITPREELSQTIISSLDFKLRPHNTTQDLLRLVPGLFIAQHAGGGKAEQLFLRGFDIDHGTDVAISVDGMPVNMVSHAHGQGYADLHFVIPETIDDLSFSKGSYDAKTGDFNTAGSVKFRTKNFIQQNILKAEVGRFNTFRGLAMINLLPSMDTNSQKHNAYFAGEYLFSSLYFKEPQDLHRHNVFLKYNGALSHHSDLSLSLSSFGSHWDASGQIPQRAVDRRLISRFGSIDPTEGGKTSRRNVNVTLNTYFHNGGIFNQQLFYVDYRFNLYSNFTFFKEDSIYGDQIQQYEHRNMYGYIASYKNQTRIGSTTVKGTLGIGYRGDWIKNIGLARTHQGKFLSDIKNGAILENSFNSYLDMDFFFSEKFTTNMGIRYDYFTFDYRSRFPDTTYAPNAYGIFSPKFNVYYKASSNVQLYVSGGYGFHSNDARVSVVRLDTTTLPRSKSIDIGSNFRIMRKTFFNIALWYMHLETEYAYIGDDGFIEPGGSTNRTGMDVSGRYQILKWLFADIDFTYSRARYEDLPEGENYVPLAPSVTTAGGFGVNGLKGFSGSLRFRYLTERPATEDYSIKASGYFLLDAVVNYQRNHWQLSLSAENLLNSKWREAQFATESQLQGELEPVTENHFTPGTPFFIKGGVSYLF